MVKPAASRPVVAMSGLGVTGQFGNQVLQYAFLRMVAERFDYDVETRPWPGQALFEIDDPTPSTYRRIRSTGLDPDHFPAPGSWYDPDRLEPCPETELLGFCLYPTSVLAGARDRFADWFRLRKAIRTPLDQRLASIRSGGGALVVLHVRADLDYGTGPFFATPIDWYTRWLDEHLDGFEDPVVYVATDRPDLVLPAFERWDVRHLGNTPEAEEVPGFFADFHVLMDADVTVGSNSTFPLAAAMLGGRDAPRYRASRAAGGFVPYDPWDASPYLIEDGGGEQRGRGEIAAYYARRLAQPSTLAGLGRYLGGRALGAVGAHSASARWLGAANRRFPMSDPLRIRLRLGSRLGPRVVSALARSGDHAACIDAWYEYSAGAAVRHDADVLEAVAGAHEALGLPDVAEQFRAAAQAVRG